MVKPMVDGKTYGIQVLIEGVEPIVDIVAIHGLDGSVQASWVDPITGASWLSQPHFLPSAIPNARILTFGYDVNTVAKSGTSSAALTDHAASLIEGMARLRRDTETIGRAIVFLAHSLGGIVTKEALVQAKLEAHHSRQDLYNSTRAILFFGTPHFGSDWAALHTNYLRLARLFTPATAHIAQQLSKESSYLKDLHSKFTRFSRSFQTIYFYEEYKTNTGITAIMLVSRDSAVPAYELNAIMLHKDHVGMVKYSSPSDDDYRTVISHLRSIVDVLSEQRGGRSGSSVIFGELKANIVKWLDTSDPYPIHRDIRSRHRKGTGAWFLEDARFARWMKEHNSMFWTYGKTGCGKTVFVSGIIEYLLESSQNDSTRAVAYHYVDFRDKPQPLCSDFLASIVAQLQRQASAIPETLLQMYNNRDEDSTVVRSAELLLDVLKELVASFLDVYIFVDALDEFHASEINLLMTYLATMHAWDASPLHIMVTSQYHLLGIWASLSDLVPVDCRIDLGRAVGAHQHDIQTHITARLREWPEFAHRWAENDELVAEIEHTLISKADSSFRWVDCQLRALAQSRTPNEIRRALSSLPKDLDETYTRIMQSLDFEDRRLAQKILVWLGLARRPLRLGELATMLSESDDHSFDKQNELSPVDILHICRDMTIREPAITWNAHIGIGMLPSTSTGANPPSAHIAAGQGLSFATTTRAGYLEVSSYDFLVLAHSSVRDWLQGPCTSFKPCIVALEVSHAAIADTLLAYLLSPNVYRSSSRSLFLDYSSNEWQYHARLGPSGSVQARVLELLRPEEEQYQAWTQSLSDKTWASPFIIADGWPKITPLTQAALFELSWAIHPLAEKLDAHVKSAELYEALYIASALGSIDTLLALLQAGADVNAKGAYTCTSLVIASAKGHLAAVRLLLQHKADPNVCSPHHMYSSPLQAAASVGTMSELGSRQLERESHSAANDRAEITRLLLDAGADPNFRGGAFGTALHAASWYGREEVARRLIASGAEVGASDESYGTPLHLSSRNGHAKIAEMLLAAGADANAPGGPYGTVLHAAIAGRTAQIFKVMQLPDVSNANPSEADRVTAIRCAMNQELKHLTVMQLLLEAGADVSVYSEPYHSVLQSAAYRFCGLQDSVWKWSDDAGVSKCPNIIQPLLGARADVEVEDGRYGSALSISPRRLGPVEISQILAVAGTRSNEEIVEDEIAREVLHYLATRPSGTLGAPTSP